LVNVSAATVCSVCAGNQVTDSNNTGVTSLLGTTANTLQGLVQSKDGWYTTLPNTRERVLASPTVLGGIVFFPSFIPVNDICDPNGDGRLYALFYLTGSAYSSPVIGTAPPSGGTTNNLRSISLGSGTGMASGLAVHIGGQGSGGGGSSSGSGCQGGVTGFLQSSTGTLSQYCTKTAGSVTSRYITWMSQRE
jgi:type IV pilus assembly protein PilY1